MSRARIRMVPDPILRLVAAPMDDDPTRLLNRLKRTLREAKGLGLAAPQIGYSLRVALVTRNDGTVLELVNPVVMDRSAMRDCAEEGCLSIPGKYVKVHRHRWVEMALGSANVRLEGMEARVAQHEIDHLDGVLITDYGSVRVVDAAR